jgi:hypothetical protein
MTNIQAHAGPRDDYHSDDDQITFMTAVFGVAVTIAFSVLILVSAIVPPGADLQQGEFAAQASITAP